MKKRLLITSIVMMLVVAVALSTATYAWFTSSATVTSSAISLTAASNSAASLGISWTDGNYGPSITAVGPTSGTFQPACPETLTNGTTLSTVDFYTASTASSAGGDMVFNSDVTQLYTTEPDSWATAHPEEDFVPDIYTWGDTDRVHQSFFVKNLSTANAINKKINVTATITDVVQDSGASALIRVGVFKKDGNNGYKLLGVLAKQEAYTYTVVGTGTAMTAEDGNYFKKVLGKYVPAYAGTAAQVNDGTKDYYRGDLENENAGATTAPAGKFFTRTQTATNAEAVYGQITGASSVNAQTTTPCVTSIDITSNQGLAADTSIELVILVWEDAVALGDAEGGKAASIALSFDVGGNLDPIVP